MRIPPVGTENVQDAPPKEKESVHSAPPYNTESQQTLYSEKILTRELGEEWEEFNS